MKDLDLNDVRTFVAAAQAGTLTAAAKELKRLERELRAASQLPQAPAS